MKKRRRSLMSVCAQTSRSGYLCFTAEEAGSTVELTQIGSPSIANTAYSTDGETWTEFTPSETQGTNVITLANVGDKVYFRNDIAGDFSDYDYLQFIMTGKIAASGNVNSMYIHDGFENLTALIHQYCYSYMFYECTSLTSAPELPATTLVKYCYASMFEDCISLTSAPALPATTLAKGCYSYMFSGCTLVTVAPALPATTLAESCYQNMFGFTSLTNAPELPATTLAEYCYYGMFWGCTSLTSAPILSATTLEGNCYKSMFEDCTSLTSAPALSATILAEGCYISMFQGCTSLTSVPALPATTLVNLCYASMFDYCAKIKMSLTQSEEYPYEYTFGAVPSSSYAGDMFRNTGGTFTGSPTQQVYYTSNDII